MKIIYCHHAQRSWTGSQSDGLTDLGQRDAELVAELLKNVQEKEKITAIYSSNFYRCMKTAEIINKYINVPIIKEPRFNEVKSVPNETWLDAQLRITEALKDIIKNNNNEDCIVCVTSGVNVISFIGLQLGIEPNKDMPFIGISSCSPMAFSFDKEKLR